MTDQPKPTSPAKPAWLEQAVFYEIYPQSFYDSNGDGIGDIPGIRQKLAYIQSLGVNAIWLNPCFTSPFQDAGYDVSDYYQVAPRYGTNADLKALFADARSMGIRILLDLVPGHTSMDHPWFKESGKHQRNEYTDWYVWTDNAWTWDAANLHVIMGSSERNGSYITNFFYFQPALNYGFADPDPAIAWQQAVDAPGPLRVRQEMRNVMKYWLDMGASGFRVDMAGSLVKKDPGQRKTAELWREMRDWLDREYPEAALVSEWANPTVAIQGGFHMDFALSFGMPGYTSLLRKSAGMERGGDRYGFAFFDPIGSGNILEFLDEYMRHYQATCGKGFIAIPTGNHDIFPRISKGRTAADLDLVFMFLMTMPGTPFIYYGDEIGMRSLDGLPSKEGGYHRTGSRTPMQWDQGVNAGFSTALAQQLYLPLDPDPQRPNVADQEADPESMLNRVRHLIALRKEHPALCASGDFAPVYAERGSYPFVYQRQQGSERILVAVNPADRPVQVKLAASLISQAPRTLYGQDRALCPEGDGWSLCLPGVSGGIYLVS